MNYKEQGKSSLAPLENSRPLIGILRDALKTTGVPQMFDDAYWAFTNPIDRITGKGRASEQRLEVPFGPGRAADNYLRDLGHEYPTLYRETSIRDLPEFVREGRVYRDMSYDVVHMANDVSLALGQGKNKGVVLEFSGKGLRGQRNLSKPGLRVDDAGPHEVVAKFNKQEQYQNNLVGFRIKPGAAADRVAAGRLKIMLGDLAKAGWKITHLDDGTIAVRRP